MSGSISPLPTFTSFHIAGCLGIDRFSPLHMRAGKRGGGEKLPVMGLTASDTGAFLTALFSLVAGNFVNSKINVSPNADLYGLFSRQISFESPSR